MPWCRSLAPATCARHVTEKHSHNTRTPRKTARTTASLSERQSPAPTLPRAQLLTALHLHRRAVSGTRHRQPEPSANHRVPRPAFQTPNASRREPNPPHEGDCRRHAEPPADSMGCHAATRRVRSACTQRPPRSTCLQLHPCPPANPEWTNCCLRTGSTCGAAPRSGPPLITLRIEPMPRPPPPAAAPSASSSPRAPSAPPVDVSRRRVSTGIQIAGWFHEGASRAGCCIREEGVRKPRA